MKFLEYNSDYVLPPVIPGFYYAKVSEMGGQTACYKNSKDLSFESNKENQHFASPFLSLLNSRLQYRQRKAWNNTKWLLLKIDIHSPSDGISYHKEGRSKIIGSSIGMDAAFKVTVPRKNTTAHKVIL